MCSGEDHGESEQQMMPAASSSRNSASAFHSLSGSRWRALANTGRPVILMVWRILCFGDGLPFLSPTMAGRDRTDGVMEQRAAANLERSVPAAVGVLESGFEFLSPAPGGRLGRPAARGRTRNLNLGWVCKRRRERKSQKTCAARTKGGGGWYPTLGLICRRHLRAVGRLAAHSNDGEGHCTLRQYPP
jgi:hypothetical protein